MPAAMHSTRSRSDALAVMATMGTLQSRARISCGEIILWGARGGVNGQTRGGVNGQTRQMWPCQLPETGALPRRQTGTQLP